MLDSIEMNEWKIFKQNEIGMTADFRFKFEKTNCYVQMIFKYSLEAIKKGKG